MERLSEYDNQTMQNEELVIFINETEVDQVMEERKNPSLQIEISKVLGIREQTNEIKLNEFWNNYKCNEKKGILIIGMLYVGLFIVLTTTQR
jgi:hypothetical protein